MKFKILSAAAGLPFLFVSCKEKQSGSSTAPSGSPAESAEVSPEKGIVLAEKQKLPPVGTVITTLSSMVMEDASLTVTAGPQVMEGTASQTGSGKESIEVLGTDKVRRLVISKKTTGKMTINGADQPTPEKPEPVEGLPVVLERNAAKWAGKLESGEIPTTEQQESIDRMVKELERNSDFQMYGDTPRKVGDKWDVDPSKLMNFSDAEEVTGTYAMEFTGLEQFEGTQCAVLTAKFDIKGKTGVSEGSPGLDMNLKGTAISKRSIADRTDLDVEVNGTMTLTGSPAPNVDLKIQGPTKIIQKITVKKP